ncbi:uncharacterized protein LOC8268050 [Ricinus communis]|uniref:uncharacterized protein LOC8268050 n=1 Tax=Ricinus communis TaxID=3988 RepID=UPI000772A3A8|nr:uncharacterized protein LOC8268050 [Ricinus communis]|eukprot:XP_015581449.1 uncharacterized protein LOC8268050 [Ricinus communis]
MAKSLRSKREKRLRAIRRDMVEPYYEKKDAAKLAAMETALSAPKLPVFKPTSSASANAMDLTTPSIPTSNANMDVEMDDDNQTKSSLKPVGKKLKKKFKLAKRNRHGKGKIRRNHI